MRCTQYDFTVVLRDTSSDKIVNMINVTCDRRLCNANISVEESASQQSASQQSASQQYALEIQFGSIKLVKEVIGMFLLSAYFNFVIICDIFNPQCECARELYNICLSVGQHFISLMVDN